MDANGSTFGLFSDDIPSGICKLYNNTEQKVKYKRQNKNLILFITSNTLVDKMSIVERIRQIQEANAKKAAEEKAAREDEWKRAEPERLAAAETKRQRELLEKQQQEEIIRESGIKEKLQQIELVFLQNTTSRLYITQRVKGAPYYGGYSYNDNEIVYELDWNYQKKQELSGRIEGYNYNSITVYLNIDNGRLHIYAGKNVCFGDKNEWINDKSVIDEALAAAFISPESHPEPGPDTSWSIN